MSTPAEMLSLGEKFKKLEFNVIGVRLKGHGTSPWDLRDRDWKDWSASVKRGFDILSAYSSKIHVIGFSTGGLLALHQAIEYPDDKLASVISVTAPIEFISKQMKFVPLLHHANKLVRWVSSEGLIPFRPNDSEHPDINYAHIPIRALYQLQKLIKHLIESPAPISCPVTLFQADQDPVVVPESVDLLYQHIEATHKHIEIIESQRHGILYEDIDNTQQKIIDAINNVEFSLQTKQQTHG